MDVWYVAYGSNMSAARLTCYLEGGCPAGGLQSFAGARDPSPPKAQLPLTLPGTVFFAGESVTWTGGRAYYDPTEPGHTAAVAYRVTRDQFEDIRAQEPPHYDRLLELGVLDGCPLLTFTSRLAKHQVPPTKPAAAYLATMSDGLAAAHRWSPARIDAYFAGLIPEFS